VIPYGMQAPVACGAGAYSTNCYIGPTAQRRRQANMPLCYDIDVRPSVVRLSVTLVDCDYIVQQKVEMGT